MKQTELEAAVLALVQQPDYRPVKARVIAEKLGLPRDRRSDVTQAIKRLVRRGKLANTANHLVKLVGRDASEVNGVFHRTSGGFGFVRPAGLASSRSERQDIYIPVRKTLDAANGDLVRVRLRTSRQGRGGRLQGEVLEVLQREAHQFVGVYQERSGAALVQVDANLFAQPIPVGDPGAKKAQEGDKVVIEMVRFPSHVSDGDAVIVEVLGPRGAPGVDTRSVMREYDLPEEFPEDVMAAARQQADRFDESIPRGRMDLTATTAITIDPADARDFDDAISLEQLDNGFWRLGVHIADVAHFVRARSVLDREARRRGVSVYLPDRVIPMLPEVVSNHLASLQPDRVRYVRTALLEFSPDGVRTSTEVRRAAIRSQRRFTYEEVDQFLAKPQPWKRKLSPQVFGLLQRMYELAMILRERRLQRGAMELTLPEIRVELDRDGRVKGAILREHTQSHQIIEEFMLAANEAVASQLEQAELPYLRRIHAAPVPRKLHALTQFVRELGVACESLESRYEIQRVLAEVRGRPEEHAVNYAVLRSMQKAVYSPEDEGHYALSSDAYCHFTSPIRRYPDLVIHRALDALRRGRPPSADFQQLQLLGEHCSEREQRAEAAERELIKIKLLTYLSERIGQTMKAVITGVEEFGIFAQGIELPAEGLAHVSSLQDDYYRYDGASHSLIGTRRGGRYRLGDLVEVEIFHVDIDRRQLDFRVIQRLERPQDSKRTHGRSAKSAHASRKQGRKKSQQGKSAADAPKRRGRRRKSK